jgi:hypothetical protein
MTLAVVGFFSPLVFAGPGFADVSVGVCDDSTVAERQSVRMAVMR